MSTNSVSFQGGRVPIPANKYIKNASIEEIAAVINKAHHSVGTKPSRATSGADMIRRNPGCVDPRTHKLSPLGEDCFNNVNGRMLGVTTKSTLSEYEKSMKDLIKKCADEFGNVYKFFDTLL